MYSQDIGMEFDIEKCAILVMKSGKQYMMEGVELPNQVVIRTLKKRTPTNSWGYWKLTSSNKWK